MSKPHAITAALDDETLADLKRLAEHFACSPDHLITTAVMRFVNEEASVLPSEFDHLPPYIDTNPLAVALDDAERAALGAYLQEGEDAIARGDFVSHEELMAELRSLDEAAMDKQKRVA